ncbi:MAG: hypothetical protein RSD32_06945, partial [Oscillospiraceae bacterium]
MQPQHIAGGRGGALDFELDLDLDLIPYSVSVPLTCHSERSEESFSAFELELDPINRNMVAHIRQCAHW